MGDIPAPVSSHGAMPVGPWQAPRVMDGIQVVAELYMHAIEGLPDRRDAKYDW